MSWNTRARKPGDVASDSPLGEEATPSGRERNLHRVMGAVCVVPRVTVGPGGRTANERRRCRGVAVRVPGPDADNGGEQRRDKGPGRVVVVSDRHQLEATEVDLALHGLEQSSPVGWDAAEVRHDLDSVDAER